MSPRGSNRASRAIQASELRSAVVDWGEAEVEHVQCVILMKLPGALGALFWKDIAGPLKIARGQVERGLFDDGWITTIWSAEVVTARVHMVQQATYIFRRQIGLERPRGVGVPECVN